ncbi:hypothetical protein OG777_10530 [Micromonospora peucetia]|uniref:hypothetical protein n=1 Tax=Micromonospora peucetia TaxID=47871 RepID=UPI00225BD418|nr:hypothetical protein [Micromonospora peucetia]MCX4387368.1 hypothetical protein [Micromonospora peucetia]
MQNASLVVAICALVLACLSLGWQAANYVLTGGRVKVELRVGATGGGAMLTAFGTGTAVSGTQPLDDGQRTFGSAVTR